VSKANATQASTLELEPNIMITDADKSTVSGLNGEQWQTLVNLLNNFKIGPAEKLTSMRNFVQWIIDISVSCHMKGKIKCLTDVRTVLECLIGILD